MKMKQRTSGFSLIELLLIIVIIAVIGAIAIPTFSKWLPNYRLKMASRELYSNLQRTKAAAIKSNTEWRVYFDNSVNPGRYFLCSGPGINGAWDTPPALGGDDVAEMTFNLSNYEGVNYGYGSALKDVDGQPFSSSIKFGDGTVPVAIFTNRGTVTTRGWVYLSNTKGTAYAVGTPSGAGAVVIRKLSGTDTWK
jgi:Tfp pilus assembly protein FimT